MTEATTRGIRIAVEPRYEPEHSAPGRGHYFFSYRVRIENRGESTAQLISRLWIVTDDRGEETRVEGPGVVGETPVLAAGESFEYTSFCPLSTAVGVMQGHYVMELTGSGERFEARIAPFTLAAPGSLN